MVETKGAPLRLARAFFSKRLAPVVYTGWRLWELRELFNTVRLLGPPMTGMVLPQVALAISFSGGSSTASGRLSPGGAKEGKGSF